MQDPKVYKVVVDADGQGRYVSWMTRQRFQLDYYLNQETKYVDGTIGIFVFNSYEAARFASTNTGQEVKILECDFTGEIIPVKCAFFCPVPEVLSHHNLEGVTLKERIEKMHQLDFKYLQGVYVGSCVVESVIPRRVRK